MPTLVFPLSATRLDSILVKKLIEEKFDTLAAKTRRRAYNDDDDDDDDNGRLGNAARVGRVCGQERQECANKLDGSRDVGQ